MEEAFRLALFCDMGERGGWGRGACGPLNVWRVLLLADTLADHSRVSRHLRQMAAQPYYKSRAQWKSLPDQATTRLRRLSYTLFVPGLATFAELAAKYDAIRQAARLGLAAEQYRFKLR